MTLQLLRAAGTARLSLNILVVLVFTASALFAQSAQAADLYVNTTQDQAEQSPADANCDAGGGQCSLRAAVETANGQALPGGDVIHLPGGTYPLTQAAGGDLDVSDDLTIIGSDSPTINAAQSDRVFDVPAAGASLELQSLAVTGGSYPLAESTGGGIRFIGSQGDVLRLDGATVSGNRAAHGGTSAGGGIYVEGTGARVELSDTQVKNNYVSPAGSTSNGATCAGGGMAVVNADVDIENSSFDGNKVGPYLSDSDACHHASGGALWIDDRHGNSVSIVSSSFTGNSAGRVDKYVFATGGGLYYNGDGTLTMSDSVVSGNVSGTKGPNAYYTDSGGAGGGLYLERGLMSIVNSQVTGNVAGDEANGAGGGINARGGLVSLQSSTVYGNRAAGGAADTSGQGGGIYAQWGSISLEDTKLTNNAAGGHFDGATGEGGGIYSYSGNTIDVSGSTVSANTAGGFAEDAPGTGGAIRSAAVHLYVDHSVLNDNVAGGGGLNSRGDAGAIEVGLWADISDSEIRGNAAGVGAGGSGGAITAALGNSALDLRRSTIADNVVGGDGGHGLGGGLFLNAPTLIENSTITGNTAGGTGHGGGVAAYGDPSDGQDILISATTFYGNSADEGEGGNLWASQIQLSDSIIAGGLAEGAGSNCLVTDLVSGGHNLEDTAQCGLTRPSDLHDMDPRLKPLRDNGGPTPTHALRKRSPAIRLVRHGCLPTDQRGHPRPLKRCDAGAYEAR